MEESVEATILASYMVPDGWSEEMFVSWMNSWFTTEVYEAFCFCFETEELIYGFCQYKKALIFEIGKPTTEP